MFGVHGALLGDNIPRAIFALVEFQHAVAHDNFSAVDLRAFSVSMRGAVGI